MSIERFIWTTHAEERRIERGFDRVVVERALCTGHATRQINRGRADWHVKGQEPNGRQFVVVYDHPHGTDREAARIVSVWPL